MKTCTFFLCMALAANAAEFKCPESAPVSQTIQAAPEGWQAVASSATVRLDRVSFYFQHPKEDGSLVPDSTKKIAGEARDLWNFPRKPGDEYWLACVYRNTTMMLTQKLDAKISSCEVRYSLMPSGERLAVKAILCK